MPATFYRIVVTNQPTPDDFRSDKELGIAPRGDEPVTRRVWDGISAFRTRAQAENKARAYPFLGSYVAQLQIPDGAPIRYERTLASRGHHTLWGSPPELLVCVVPGSIEPV
jgi:hypothetical protein